MTLYLGLGAIAGLVAGLLGVGGGLIIVPVLALLFARQGIAAPVVMHLAIGTSLASIIFTSLSSVWAHHRRQSVRWRDVGRLAPGIVIGAWLGAALADTLPAAGLRQFFGLFELYVAIQMTFKIKPSPQRNLPGRTGMLGVGGLIGAISSVVGIGGGSFTVPFLSWCNVSMREAVGTSSACGIPIAIAGAAGFVVAGWGEAGLPANSLGYVYLYALLGIASTSILFAPLGARLAHWLPADRLKQIFALLLYMLAAFMLFGE
ncbi:Uncharacterized UPF0721 integral membrane protein [hydrothermal vent metagenome]|uniref:Uncharacterized UPF0721 integral membrane protein n=1 Tax=hydrothermal vent metagenome TaxID=652676 RepID=A0A3B0Y9K8_9ZZZZ